jgi:hypothetical protein
MKLISAFGSPFSHDITSCHNIAPTKFEWVFDDTTSSDIEVYFEYNILGGKNSNSKNKFLWLCESRSIVQPQMLFVKNNYNYLKSFYKKIFTHDRSLLELDEIFSYCPPAANHTWVKDRGIHKKSKMVSMVSSGKTMCEGHVYRNNKMKEFQNSGYPIDYYGKLFNPFKVKEDVLRDYHFSITIENDSYSNYYTEKIMDCFSCGTIPVYYGTPELPTMFNMDGIILLNDTFDINTLSSDLYFSKMDAIKDNFERCINHQTSDDYIFDRIIELI